MADINETTGGNGKRSLNKSRKMHAGQAKVDLTPMVDLGFLLIAFFMLTMVLSEYGGLKVITPAVTSNPAPIGDCQIMNLLVDSTGQVFVYEGLDLGTMQVTSFDRENGIRQRIIAKSEKIAASCPKTESGKSKKLMCLLKFLPGAKYKSVVDMIDEMQITGVANYAMQEPVEIEIAAVKQQTELLLANKE